MSINIEMQRRIDRIIGSVICGLLSLLAILKRPICFNHKPSGILVLLLSEMGSLVLARPMFDRLREKYPNASIYVLCFERNREFLELINVIQPGHIFTVREDGLLCLLKDSISALVKVHHSKIDTVLDCELFSRIGSIYSFLSGAKIRVGFHPHTQEGLYRGNFINRPVLYNPYQHISEQFVSLVEAIESLGVPTVKRHVPKKRITLPPFKVKEGEIRDYLKKVETDFPQKKKKGLVLIYPSGGLLPIRAWPLKNYSLIAKDLVCNGYIVGIIGMKEDKRFADVIMACCRHNDCIDLTGYTKTVKELIILFHIAILLIANDGGPGHFASLTPISSIIFFGPETPALYGTLDNKAVEFYMPLSCSPCLTAYNHRNSPCDGDNVCLKSIDPGEVLVKAYEILNKLKSYKE